MNKWTYKYNLEHDLPYSKTFIGGRTSSCMVGVQKTHIRALPHTHTRTTVHTCTNWRRRRRAHTFAHTGTHRRIHSFTLSLSLSLFLACFSRPSLSHTGTRVWSSLPKCVCVCVCGCGCALPIPCRMLMYSSQMDDDGRRWWQQDGLQLIALPTFMYFYVIKLLDSYTHI